MRLLHCDVPVRGRYKLICYKFFIDCLSIYKRTRIHMHCHWRQAVVKCMHSGGIKMFVHLRLLSQEYSTNSELEVWRLVRCFGIGVWKGPFGLVRLPWFGDMLNTNLEHYEVGTRFLIDIDFDMQANSWRYGEISIYIYIYTQIITYVSIYAIFHLSYQKQLYSVKLPRQCPLCYHLRWQTLQHHCTSRFQVLQNQPVCSTKGVI